MSEELKSCPFCGGNAVVCETDDEKILGFVVMCENCGIRTPVSDNEQNVINAWNKRI